MGHFQLFSLIIAYNGLALCRGDDGRCIDPASRKDASNSAGPDSVGAPRSGHNSAADIDTVLDFLNDQIAVRKELLRIASLAKVDEPLKEGEEPAAATDEKPVEKDACLNDSVHGRDCKWIKNLSVPPLLCKRRTGIADQSRRKPNFISSF